MIDAGHQNEGIYNVTCDVCGDGGDIHADSWQDMISTIKESGWLIKLINKEWLNFCPECKGVHQR